jgi:hypothetical protein
MEKKRNPLAIFSYLWSFVLGFLYIYLFAWKTPGISHILFYAVAFGTAIIPVYLFNGGKNAKRLTNWVLAIPFALLLSTTFIYRTNEFWIAINFLTLPFIYAILSVAAYFPDTFKNFSLVSYVTLPFTVFISWFSDWKIFRKNVKGMFFKSEKTRELMKRIWKGFLISIPFLVVFGWLLVSADEVFADLVIRFLEKTLGAWFKDWPTAIDTFVKLIVAVLAAMYFMVFNYSLWNKESKVGELITKWQVKGKEAKKNWDVLVASVFMSMLNLLFVAFVVVQFVYLFGGSDNVIGSDAGFTYAEYARKGFWELLFAAGFSYIIILLMNFKVFTANRVQTIAFRLNYFIMTASVMVMTYSAFARMGLYESVYGYTNLRLLVQLALVVIGLMYIFLSISIFRKNPKRFVGTTNAVLAFVVYFILAILPSDYFVAEMNYNRYKDTGLLDVEYMINLSDEAVPVLVDLAKKEKDSNAMGKVVMAELEGRYEKIEENRTDWQSWNYVDQKNKEELSELLDDKISWKSEAEESLNLFLTDYTNAIRSGQYDIAFEDYWSAKTEQDFTDDLDSIEITKYKVSYIPEYEYWPLSNFDSAVYRERYYWNGMSVSIDLEYNSEDRFGFISKQCRTEDIGVVLEDGEWKVVDASQIILGENPDRTESSYIWKGDELLQDSYWNNCD